MLSNLFSFVKTIKMFPLKLFLKTALLLKGGEIKSSTNHKRHLQGIPLKRAIVQWWNRRSSDSIPGIAR